MENIIWLAPLTIAVLAILFAVPAIAIAKEKSGERIGRKDFAIASLLFFIIYPIFNRVFSRLFENMGDGGIFLIGILIIIFGFIWYKYSKLVVRRVRDAGLHKKYCYIIIIPLVNLLFVIYLVIKKSAQDKAPLDLESSA